MFDVSDMTLRCYVQTIDLYSIVLAAISLFFPVCLLLVVYLCLLPSYWPDLLYLKPLHSLFLLLDLFNCASLRA